jgi:hypothetical protein
MEVVKTFMQTVNSLIESTSYLQDIEPPIPNEQILAKFRSKFQEILPTFASVSLTCLAMF